MDTPVLTHVFFEPRYIQDLHLDESNIRYEDYATGRALLRDQSKIPENQLVAHVAENQRRAYALMPYSCIGLLRFLICTLSTHHVYPPVLEQLKAGATYLNLGACFAQDIRKVAFGGAPVEKCTAVDLEPGFFSISHDLFRDSAESPPARFSGGDLFDDEQEIWTELRGRTDVLHVSSFFHMFALPKQKTIAQSVSRLMRPVQGSLVLGMQLAASKKREICLS
ncbi:MAG: hypothetical protein Q9213_005253 [Squamulea squamosa]